MLKIKRVYEKPEKEDGIRMLVDRLWPRGLAKERVKIDRWLKDLAPSHTLRRWFSHREERWEEFKSRYRAEIKSKKYLLKDLRKLSRSSNATLLYAAKDKERNNAKALLEFLQKQ